MSSTASEFDSSSQPKPASQWFRFSLKSLLIVTALVAVYFGGRASMRPNWFAPQAGTWQMNMPSGHQRAVTLATLPDGMFLLGTGGNLGGQYRWNNGQLQVVVPADNRYMGLTWQWDGEELVLVAEPASRPSGATYLGTRLRFVSPDISTTAQNSVPLIPSRIQLQPRQQRQQGQKPQPQQQPRARVVQSQKLPPTFQPGPWRDPAPGEWQLTLPAGFTRSVHIKKLPDGQFELVTGLVVGGTYQVRDGQLEVVKPRVPRLKGLTWAWQQDELVLVTEPMPPPTGSSYRGARMRPASDEPTTSDDSPLTLPRR
jgi:hypothetical protein